MAKLCRDTTGQLASQFSILALWTQDQVSGSQDRHVLTRSPSRCPAPAAQLPAASGWTPQGRGEPASSPKEASAEVRATGMEEGPWVQAAHWLAARRGPRLICHGQQAGLAPARAPRKAGASLDSGIWSPDRMARPQEGALSQGKAGPRGAALDQPGPRVARGPEAKRRPLKAGPPWAWKHICPEGRQSDKQTDRQTACLGSTDSGSGDLLLVWS